jgi:hypothetical protein
MENIIIRNKPPLGANTLLMYIIMKGDKYQLPHMNSYNHIFLGGEYNKHNKGDEE